MRFEPVETSLPSPIHQLNRPHRRPSASQSQVCTLPEEVTRRRFLSFLKQRMERPSRHSRFKGIRFHWMEQETCTSSQAPALTNTPPISSSDRPYGPCLSVPGRQSPYFRT